jgi:hypothetical protein
MTSREQTIDQMTQEYREESVKPAVITMLVAVVVVALPLGWIINRIGDAGSRSADISKYKALAALVDGNVVAIRNILENEVVDEDALSGVVAAPVVTLITPDIGPTNLDEAAQNTTKQLDVELKAIYWNPREPLVTLGNENYRVGEKVQGFTIMEIRKTEVVFRSPLGETVVKYFYEYLDKP